MRLDYPGTIRILIIEQHIIVSKFTVHLDTVDAE